MDRPISHAGAPGDAIRHPVVEPDRDVRPFQDVLLDLGVRLGLPGFCDDHGKARYPGGYSDYIVNHQRSPVIGPLAGWRGTEGDKSGRGEVNPNQLEKYLENECFWSEKLADNCRYYKHVNQDYLNYAQSMGWKPDTKPVILQVYSEDLQRFRLAAMGFGEHLPPIEHRQRLKEYFTPLPIWYAPFEEKMIDTTTYPLHAITQRPMHMYHSWGSQNAWLRQITHTNAIYIHPTTAAKAGIEDGSWVHVENELASVIAPACFHYGVNKDTVWTWNAIAKRKGTWGLDETAPEANQAFLLNHLIRDLLPLQKGGMRYSNSDPVTGQAAWYDLRVRVRPCTEKVKQTSPLYKAMNSPLAKKSAATPSFDARARDQPMATKAATNIKEWIANRKENSANIDGIQPGTGNLATSFTQFGNGKNDNSSSED